VLVVSTDGDFREAIRERLARAGISVVGHVSAFGGNGHPAVDVLVIDGREAVSASPDVTSPVLFVGGDLAALTSRVTMHQGPRGVVPETATTATLDAAVRALAAGLTVTPPDPAKGRRESDSLADAGLEEALTPREQEILGLVAQGLSNRAIARRLGISDHTVKFHLSSIFGKLDVSTRTGAVRRGLSRGLITI
jgi:DNA-binding NarL/FixJ family response regulator